MQSTCRHSRSEVIAKRDGVDYVRCIECGQIFEADDLEEPPVYEGDDEEEPSV